MRRTKTGHDIAAAFDEEVARHEAEKDALRAEAHERHSTVEQRLATLEHEAAVLRSVTGRK